MIYISAAKIDIKSAQDAADSTIRDEYSSLVLCDGIGEFKDSDLSSALVVSKLLEMGPSVWNEMTSFFGEIVEEIKYHDLKSGTTCLYAQCNNKLPYDVKIAYVGNGGITHLYGNYSEFSEDGNYFNYSELLLPHVDTEKRLTKHLSYHSSSIEFTPSVMQLSLANSLGDILIFYTDGIASRENQIIIKDNKARYWRNEPENIQIILVELNKYLYANANAVSIQDGLPFFLNELLSKLKQEKKLEDDASLGIIITDEVIKYYKSKHHDS